MSSQVVAPVTGPMPIRTPVSEANGMMSYPWQVWFRGILQAKFPSIPAFFADTHSGRTNVQASQYANGSIFYETDRQVVYIAISGVWTYLTGVYSATQVQIPTDLGTSDAGFEMDVADYGHGLVWSGSSWSWAAGDSGSGYVVAFVSAPPVVGYAPCDGSANVLALQSDGSLQPFTVPNTPGSYFRQ